MPTIREIKKSGLLTLNRAKSDEAALEAEILLAHALRITRIELLAHDERAVPAAARRRYDALIRRRAKREPIAYLVGQREFFGLPFFVNKNVLIPRPETELLVEEILKQTNSPSPLFCQPKADQPRADKEMSRPVIIDIGTGSGAIAIAVAKNAPEATVIATDISAAALRIANQNAALNDVQDRIIFERADLLPKKIKIPANAIIAANLPYLPTKVWQKCAPDVKKFEPHSALVGGSDGLRVYDKLFHQIAANFSTEAMPVFLGRERGRPLTSQTRKNRRAEGLIIICEIDPSQKISFPKLVQKHFPRAKVKIKNDLAGRPRVASIALFLK